MLKALAVASLVVLLLGCAKKNSPENKGSDDLSFSGDVGEQTSELEISLPGLLNFLDTAKTTIPSVYFPLLTLDSSYDGRIQLKSIFHGKRMLVLSRPKGGCTPINCQHGVKAYVFDNNQNAIISSEEMDLTLQSEPKFVFEHGMFLLVTDRVKDYEENDNDVMEATSEPYDVDYLVVFFEGTFVPARLYSGKQLRIIRNYIFARYGYKFTSSDLQDYFKQFDWYKPLYNNVDNKLSENDKKIIKAILTLERK